MANPLINSGDAVLVVYVRSACKLFVSFALLPPYGQWAYGESRVQNISWEHLNSSLVNFTLRPAATIQHSTFKTQHCAPRLRVQKNIRVIRYITSLRSVGLRRISCSKHLVRASKFIIGQFHIAASRNNSTFNIQNSTLRSAPPCAINIRLILL